MEEKDVREIFEKKYLDAARIISAFDDESKRIGKNAKCSFSQKVVAVVIAISTLAVLVGNLYIIRNNSLMSKLHSQDYRNISTPIFIWIPVIVIFAAMLIYTKTPTQYSLNYLHITWLRNKIMPMFYAGFDYDYKNCFSVQQEIEKFMPGYNVICKGGLIHSIIDIYEILCVSDSENSEDSLKGLAILAPNINQCDERIDWLIMAYGETGENRKLQIKKQGENLWIICPGLGLDNCMFPGLGDLHFIDKNEFFKNYEFINKIEKIFTYDMG